VQNLYVENVTKIALLRANALGDFIVTLPALQAIRATYPAAELVLLGKPWHNDFLKSARTPIDRVVTIPVSKGIREEAGQRENPEELSHFFESIQQEQFDIAVQLQGKGIAANPFVNKLGAKLTVGLTCPEAEPLDRNIPFYYYQNEAIRYLEVAGLIGATPVSLEPSLTVLPQDHAEVTAFVAMCPGLTARNTNTWVVLHPCAIDIRRMWPEEKFIQAGNELARKGYAVIFTGSATDATTVGQMIDQMSYPAVNACGKLSLGGLAALLAQSAVVISSDTGPLHLARAVSTPTVGIYWAPNLINWGPVTRAMHRPAVSWRMACPLCGIVPNNPYPFEPQSDTCKHLVSFVQDVPVAEVVEQAEHLLHYRPQLVSSTQLSNFQFE
jgi:ADP-heptose:LPS heptosyltransferase